MQNFRLKYKPFPPELHGQLAGITGGKPDGNLTVIIDSTLSEEEQKKTLKHELAHIALGHFQNTGRDMMRLEEEADAKADRMTDTELEALMQWAI